MSSSMASMRRRRWFLFVVSPGAVRFHAFGAPVVGGVEMGGKRLGGPLGVVGWPLLSSLSPLRESWLVPASFVGPEGVRATACSP